MSETFGDEKCAVRMANTHRILLWLAVTVVKLEDTLERDGLLPPC